MIRFMLPRTRAFSLTALSFFSLAHAQQAGPGGRRSNAHGDPLPPDAVARIGTTRLRHAAYVASLAFSPDGKRISAATIWFDLGVWDAHTGQALAFRSSRREKGLFRPSVSPDGSLFAGRTDNGELGVQQALSGKIVHRFAGKKELCEGLVFSRDNRWLASADRDGNTYLWDLQSGQLAHQIKAKPPGTFDDFCHAFTPDGGIFIQALGRHHVLERAYREGTAAHQFQRGEQMARKRGRVTRWQAAGNPHCLRPSRSLGDPDGTTCANNCRAVERCWAGIFARWQTCRYRPGYR